MPSRDTFGSVSVPMLRLGVLAVVGLFAGCSAEKSHQLMIKLKQMEDKVTNSKYVDEMVKGCRPNVLKQLYYQCDGKQAEFYRYRPDEMRESPYCYAKTAILLQLGSLREDSALRVLVEMLADEGLSFDGESAVMLGHCISMHGRKSIQYLEMVEGDKKLFAAEIIAAIQRGELFGP